MRTIDLTRFLTVFALLGANLSLSLAEPLDTAITYHGRLNQGGSAAQGLYDFRLAIYDAITNGNVIGSVNVLLSWFPSPMPAILQTP